MRPRLFLAVVSNSQCDVHGGRGSDREDSLGCKDGEDAKEHIFSSCRAILSAVLGSIYVLSLEEGRNNGISCRICGDNNGTEVLGTGQNQGCGSHGAWHKEDRCRRAGARGKQSADRANTSGALFTANAGTPEPPISANWLHMACRV